MTDEILLPSAIFTRAKLMMNVLRDHIATLSLVLKHIARENPNGYENAIATRLDNHKSALNTFITASEYIHQDPITPNDLIKHTNLINDQCAYLILKGDAYANHNPEIVKCTKALLEYQKSPTLRTKFKYRKYLKRANNIQPEVIAWMDLIEQAQKNLTQIHETLNFMSEKLNQTDIYNTELTPAELPENNEEN